MQKAMRRKLTAFIMTFIMVGALMPAGAFKVLAATDISYPADGTLAVGEALEMDINDLTGIEDMLSPSEALSLIHI